MTASMVTARPLFVMSRVGFLTVRHTPHSRECGVTVRPDALYLRVLRTRKHSIRRDTSSVGASLLANDLREQARSHWGGLTWNSVSTAIAIYNRISLTLRFILGAIAINQNPLNRDFP